MAEFLIYDQDNWMDVPSKDRPDLTGKENVDRKILEEDLSIEAKTIALGVLQGKYDARYHKGDIVEVREDGAPSGRLEKSGVDFVCVPIAFKDVKQYTMPLLEEGIDSLDPDNPDIKRRRKYWLDMAGLILVDHEILLTVSEFNFRLKTKT